ncbi:histone acetyltransferase subunit nua4 [Babesia ovata]|uniref:Histone acetyltransferase subunit nua4 n=1 Tax=Babesia ovata TaxID=189622 RepID=A0A2H6K900_9APIC|nr:histone acetyltransferase subunit nua4 [Babesia ovata]GBE59475.1 histone acetyltransferase subunit nua4 [Babesia ovata]
MSASPSTLLLPAECSSFGDSTSLPRFIVGEGGQQKFVTYKRQDNTSKTAATDDSSSSATAAPRTPVNTSKTVTPTASAQRRTGKDVSSGTRKRARRGRATDSASRSPYSANGLVSDISSVSSLGLDVGGSRVPSGASSTASAKEGPVLQQTTLDRFIQPVRSNEKAADHRKHIVIDTTLVDEALDAVDIANAHSELHDIDSLSLSQSLSLSTMGSADEDDERKRKRRKCSRLQETIMRVIAKTKTDIEHLEEKISSLEEQYFYQHSETTGLVKGWDNALLGGLYCNPSSNKARKGTPAKAKQLLGHSLSLVNDHIFSLTSSTCGVSKTLTPKPE